MSYKELIATATVLSHNIKVMHWNMEGCGFKPIHKEFDEVYELIEDHQDAFVERERALMRFPDSSLSACIRDSRVKETKQGKVTTCEAVSRLIADLTTYVMLIKEKRVDASKEAD